jgi:hypothetical protein
VIRAMLRDEQRAKYPAALPGGATASAHADVEHWMGLAHARPTTSARVEP